MNHLILANQRVFRLIVRAESHTNSARDSFLVLTAYGREAVLCETVRQENFRRFLMSNSKDSDYGLDALENRNCPPDEPSDAEFQRWLDERRLAIYGGEEEFRRTPSNYAPYEYYDYTLDLCRRSKAGIWVTTSLLYLDDLVGKFLFKIRWP